MKFLNKFFVLTAITVLLYAGDLDESTQFGFRIIQDAEARLGRPLTPVSVAGVHRRTRRRTAVATAAVVGTAVVATPYVVPTTTYVAPASTTVVVEQAPAPAPKLAVGTVISALPAGCNSMTAGGANYFNCNGIYLKPVFLGENIAYKIVDTPD